MHENSSWGYTPQLQDLTRHYFIGSTSGASYFYTASLYKFINMEKTFKLYQLLLK